MGRGDRELGKPNPIGMILSPQPQHDHTKQANGLPLYTCIMNAYANMEIKYGSKVIWRHFCCCPVPES